MKSRAVPDQQDPFGGAFNPAWDEQTFVNFLPPAPGAGGSLFPGVAPILPTPALSNEAITAEAAQTGPTTTDVVTSGGITFDLIFDAAATAAPASFRAGIEQAASILAATITNKITVNIEIDYSGTGGGASAGPDNGQYVTYSTVRADLIAGATPGDTTFNSLPTGSTIQGQSQVIVWNTQLKLFGLLSPNSTTTDDGSATFATDISSNLLVGVALHELTHALGRITYGPQPDIFDFYRFTSPGTRLFTDNIPAAAAYFSLDGGNTKLAYYGLNSDPSDFLNPPGSTLTPNDPFNEFYNNNTLQKLTAVDLQQLDALGFDITAPDTQPPTLVNDNLLSILAGTTATLTSSLLSASDNDSSAAQLLYTVTTGPTDGTLLLNGSATTSFTQADINNGLVSYHETANFVTSDSFLFTVTDGAGNVTGTESFQIGIESVFSGNRADYQMSYNSATQTFTVTDERPGSPDGTHTLNDVEQLQFANGSSTYSFNAAGALVSETFDNINGTHWVNAFDTVGNQTWAWEISTYDGSGNLTTQTGLNHDGTHFLTLYDADHQYSWTTATINFDANWNETSITGTDANGSHSLTSQEVAAAYDVTQWSATPSDTILNQVQASGVVASAVNSAVAGHPSVGTGQDGFVFNFASANSTVAANQISHFEFGVAFAAGGAPSSATAHMGSEFTFENTHTIWSDSADAIAKPPGFDAHHATGFLLA